MQRLSSLSLRMAAEPTRVVQVPWWLRSWAWLQRVIAEASPSPAPQRTRARPEVVAAAVPQVPLGDDPSQTQMDPTLVLETTRALVPVPLADTSSPHARAIYARAERRAQAEEARRATPTANARTPLPRDDTPVLATLVPGTRPGSPARTTRAAERGVTVVARGATPPTPPARARGDAAPTARTECGVLAARPHTPDVVERFTAALRQAPRAATIAERDALAVRPARAVVHTSTPCAVPVYASETYVHERG
jgi:hypothetical protein